MSKNIILCARMDEACFEALKLLPTRYDLSNAKIYLVHGVKVEPYTYDFFTAYYPTQEQYEPLRKQMLDLLNAQAGKFKNAQSKTDFEAKVFLDANPKEKVLQLVSELKANLIVTTTKRRSGVANLFHSSFSSHLVAHAPCDVLVLREK
jgi:nucleotide-binding universal stress UspA family protein